jgi:hypothetical protein
VSQVVRGVDEDPVLPRDKVKSINSCKSFEATSDAATIARWLGVLAQELAERCAEDEHEHGRQPRSLGMYVSDTQRSGTAAATAAAATAGACCNHTRALAHVAASGMPPHEM